MPTIVLAELYYISEKGRIILSFNETLKKIEAHAKFNIIPLDIGTIKETLNIPYDLEMHDKLIVATAIQHNAGLITKDEEIRKSDFVTVYW